MQGHVSSVLNIMFPLSMSEKNYLQTHTPSLESCITTNHIGKSLYKFFWLEKADTLRSRREKTKATLGVKSAGLI